MAPTLRPRTSTPSKAAAPSTPPKSQKPQTPAKSSPAAPQLKSSVTKKQTEEQKPFFTPDFIAALVITAIGFLILYVQLAPVLKTWLAGAGAKEEL